MRGVRGVRGRGKGKRQTHTHTFTHTHRAAPYRHINIMCTRNTILLTSTKHIGLATICVEIEETPHTTATTTRFLLPSPSFLHSSSHIPSQTHTATHRDIHTHKQGMEEEGVVVVVVSGWRQQTHCGNASPPFSLHHTHHHPPPNSRPIT